MPETTALLAQQWDMIFFTGSPPVGKIVHQAAAKNLTPCVLELGGKNPTIVHSSANLKSAARRIAYGRFMNSGHICTAPDHVLVWPEVKDEFVQHMKDTIRDFYGDDPQAEPRLRTHDQPAQLRPPGRAARQRQGRGRRTDRSRRPLHRADRAGRCRGRLADHEGRGVRADPAGARDRFGRGRHRWVNSRPSPLGLYIFAEDEDVVDRSSSPPTPATRRSTTAPSIRSFPSFRSAAWATPAWASTTAAGASRPSPTRAACLTTAADRPRRALPAVLRAPTRTHRRILGQLIRPTASHGPTPFELIRRVRLQRIGEVCSAGIASTVARIDDDDLARGLPRLHHARRGNSGDAHRLHAACWRIGDDTPSVNARRGVGRRRCWWG